MTDHPSVREEPSALVVENLGVRFGGFRAVDGVSFAVPFGEIHGLIGPNGAGKTTCFNAVCGFIRPSSGEVWVHGSQMVLGRPKAAWQAGIARTFQKTELFWTLTVGEHMELARRRAVRRNRNPPKIDDLKELLGIGGEVDRTVASLPLGTMRLVELGRAISTGANLLLIDEPCSGLDRAETSQLEVVLRSLQRDLRLSLLIVEHDMEFILSIAKKVLVLNNGRLIAEGSPAAIRDNDDVRRAYLGGVGTTEGETKPIAPSSVSGVE